MYQRNVIISLSKTESGTELVSAADFKTYAKIGYSDEDSLISGLITSARQVIERECNLSLMDCTITLIVDHLGDSIDLPYPTIATITSVSEMDSEFTYTALDTDYYSLQGGRLLVRSTCGMHKIIYTTTQRTDQAIKDAIKARVLAMYEHRGDDEAVKHHPKWIESNLILAPVKNYSWV